jgi:hypothetical protein
MARHLAEVGLKARYQPMTDTSGNVLAELRGSGGGASLMLYAPIDTHLDLTEAESEWTGAKGEADMQPRVPRRLGVRPGRLQPQGHGGHPDRDRHRADRGRGALVGDLLVGMADGGMPVDISARNHGACPTACCICSTGARPPTSR